MSGICERGFNSDVQKFGILGALSELLEPHLFGRTGALKFGANGVHLWFHFDKSCFRAEIEILYEKHSSLIKSKIMYIQSCLF